MQGIHEHERVRISESLCQGYILHHDWDSECEIILMDVDAMKSQYKD
jgi:hypothetical protein